MTRAVNCWAIYHPLQGLLLHSIHANQRGAWAMNKLCDVPQDWNLPYCPPDIEAKKALGFRAIQVRIKYEEPET